VVGEGWGNGTEGTDGGVEGWRKMKRQLPIANRQSPIANGGRVALPKTVSPPLLAPAVQGVGQRRDIDG
jgi:hypothetical protein